MRETVQQLFVALAFYTRIPSPGWVEHTASRQLRSATYAPAAGWVVGLAAACVFTLSTAVLPASIAVLLGMATSVWVTGALHEDALADFCDAFGGFHDKTRTLAIMKDSGTGAYGVVALVFALSLKFLTLLEFARLSGNAFGSMALLLLSAHGLSRLLAVSFMRTQVYVSTEHNAKSTAVTGAPTTLALSVSALVALLPLLFLSGLTTPWMLAGLIAMLVARHLTGRLFLRRLGGYTGDCLGAVQQTTELALYVFACAALFVAS